MPICLWIVFDHAAVAEWNNGDRDHRVHKTQNNYGQLLAETSVLTPD